jgi:hypothetical protein
MDLKCWLRDYIGTGTGTQVPVSFCLLSRSILVQHCTGTTSAKHFVSSCSHTSISSSEHFHDSVPIFMKKSIFIFGTLCVSPLYPEIFFLIFKGSNSGCIGMGSRKFENYYFYAYDWTFCNSYFAVCQVRLKEKKLASEIVVVSCGPAQSQVNLSVLPTLLARFFGQNSITVRLVEKRIQDFFYILVISENPYRRYCNLTNWL